MYLQIIIEMTFKESVTDLHFCTKPEEVLATYFTQIVKLSQKDGTYFLLCFQILSIRMLSAVCIEYFKSSIFQF